ncbi:sulfatase-like hydrolase/transferase [Planctomycetota bacterium]
MTGRYQQRFGHECNLPYDLKLEDTTVGLPLSETLLPEVFKKHGYATCAIGKWHLGDNSRYWPNERGFDHWFGFAGGGLSFWGDLGKKPALLGVVRNGDIVPKQELTYLTDDFTNEAVNFIKDHREQPFFMYLAYNAPHAPIHATREYLAHTDHIEDGPRSAYAAMVVGVDVGVGKLKATLKDMGLLKNTLIFFYSDNGGHLHGASSQPYRGHKGMLFEGGIRVPFCVSWPAVIPGGQTFTQPIIALDIFPTVLAAAGIKIPQSLDLDGTDLLPYVTSQHQLSPHDSLYWRYSGGKGYAVRHGQYKLVRSEYKQRVLLFDLKHDPLEHHDLADAMPEKVKELQTLYHCWSQETVAPKWDDPHIENVHKEEANRQAARSAASRGEKK